MNNSNSNFIDLSIGAIISSLNKKYIITNFLDMNNILAKDLDSGQIKRLRLSEITYNDDDNIKKPLNTITIPDKDWNEAIRKFEIIQPLLKNSKRNKNLVKERADEFNLYPSTLYRWISDYESTGLISSLVRSKRSDKGQNRLSLEIEEIIRTTIEDVYLTKQRHSIKSLYDAIAIKCNNAKINTPHPNTIRNRISSISDEIKISRRYGSKKAINMFQESVSAFPNANYPLSYVQIDHTKLDIILVDDILRKPIGRPWITLAFDVFSRMICGFYISFDPPNAMSTGLCLTHAILPKEKWLIQREISSSWPVWGVPTNIHLDNAKEFRGNMLKRACQEYGININWRPVARPHFGGHVERILGTLLKEIHELPGTTFSNPKERGEYKSEDKAAMTLNELEKWLTIYIIDVYHKRIHSEIQTTPEKQWEDGILGTKNSPGRGLPPRIIDEQRLILEFMPYEERTIQDYGVVIDEIHYYSDILRKWINSKDITNPKVKRKFIFKRDPRNISSVYFLDPELDLYFSIPYRNTSHPPISIWELREAQKFVKSQAKSILDEVSIFDAYNKLSSIEKESIVKSKKARRSIQRRLDSFNRGNYSTTINLSTSSLSEETSNNNGLVNLISPFDDIDDEDEVL